MSDWENTRQVCLEKLEVAREVHSATQEIHTLLTGLIQDDKLRQELTHLSKIRSQIEDQYKRLKRNQFEVAVIGLEKAGKSTLLNGWLGADILPNLDERCTYTTTEIRSASSENQKIEIEYFTREEFEQDLEAKCATRAQMELNGNATGRSYDEIVKEIEEIENTRQTIDALLDRPIEKQNFSDFDEVKEVLKTNIADPAHARAVKRLVIHTPKLLSKKDVVFYDVPGFNSPVKLHREQAEERLKAVDIVLYAKPFETPSLTGDETSILDKNDIVDPYVKVGDKFFVALTRIDSAKTQKRYNELLEKAYIEWNGKSQVPKDRVLPVCPPLEIEDFCPELKECIRQDLQICNGGNNGIADLKDAIDSYIETKRAQVVRNRCEQTIQSLRKIAQQLLLIGQENSPTSLEQAEQEQRAYEDEMLMSWWAEKWIEIREKFTEILNKKYFPKAEENPDGLTLPHQNLTQFKQKFDEHLDVLFQDVLNITDKKILNLYRRSAADGNLTNPKVGHQEIRDYLFDQIINRLERLSIELAQELVQVIKELLGDINHLLWDCLTRSELCKKVHKKLFENNLDDFEYRLHIALNALLLRLARPAANLFLKYERFDRKQLLDVYRIEIVMMDYFYQSENKSGKKSLANFLANGGSSTNKNSSPTNTNSGSIKPLTQFKSPESASSKANQLDFDPATLNYADPAEKYEDVKNQVIEDLNIFQDYLKNGVYYAAGLEAFSKQELDRIKRTFIDYEEKERGWQHIIFSAIRMRCFIPDAPILVDRVTQKRRLKHATDTLAASLQKMQHPLS